MSSFKAVVGVTLTSFPRTWIAGRTLDSDGTSERRDESGVYNVAQRIMAGYDV